MKEILVVEDDRTVSGGLCWHLQRAGYAPFPVYSEKEALEAYSRKEYALLLLDVNLPDGSGFSLARKLKEKRDTPVIFLTGCDQDEEMLEGFEAGADDYVTKPFKPKELVARVRARLRRTETKSSELIEVGDLLVDVSEHTVTRHSPQGGPGEELSLTPLEFDLLVEMARKPGQVHTREELLEKVWGYRHASDTRLVNVHVQRLRAKIEHDPEDPQIVLTVRGVGYKTGKND